jgi:probable HAF family extracellular repeat protein
MVVGQSVRADGEYTACRWLAASAFDLGDFGSTPSDANATNNYNQICGVATLNSGVQQAALWQNGRIRNLGSLAGLGSQSTAYALTESTDPIVYGASELAGGSNRAVYWQQLQIFALPHDSDWLYSVAKVVTYNNAPAGVAFSNSQNRQLTVLWNTSPVEVPGLAMNSSSEPRAGVSSGYLVGESDRGPGSETEAVLFQVTQPGQPAQSIQNLPAAVRSYAFGVNVYGVIVGGYQNAANETSAFVYAAQDGAQMIDLNDLLQPGGPVTKVLSAHAINDDGIILAQCEVNGTTATALLWPI